MRSRRRSHHTGRRPSASASGIESTALSTRTRSRHTQDTTNRQDERLQSHQPRTLALPSVLRSLLSAVRTCTPLGSHTRAGHSSCTPSRQAAPERALFAFVLAPETVIETERPCQWSERELATSAGQARHERSRDCPEGELSLTEAAPSSSSLHSLPSSPSSSPFSPSLDRCLGSQCCSAL